MIKVGDRVKFLNDIGAGEVISIKGSVVTVDREDGFLVPALISDVVVVQKEDELNAIRRIGVSDYKPGRQQKKGGEEQKDVKKPKENSSARYGKISLVDDYEDEEIVDLHSIRETYTRNLAAVNRAELEMEEREKRVKRDVTKPVNDTSIFDEKNKSEEKKLYEQKPLTKEEVKQKEEKKERVQPQSVKSKKEIDVVDLHSHCLLESEQGLSSGDILNIQIENFRKELDNRLKTKRHGKVIFIHGIGSGKLKMEITRTLKYNYSTLSHQDASFKEYGYGAVMVIY